MNIITDLLSYKYSDNVYNIILMIVDCYIKIVRYISISKILTAVEFADIFFQEIICWYDIFKEIVLNRDSIFMSIYWFKIYYIIKIKYQLSTVFYS